MNTKTVRGIRHFSRVPFRAQVQLQLHDRVLPVHLLDIALKGALVETEDPEVVALDEDCRLLLPLMDEDDAIVMNGCVAHLEGQHVGIQCLDIDITSMTRLRRLLELNTGDAELVDRELSLLFSS